MLNVKVPLAYKKVTGGGVGTRMYLTMDDPCNIIHELRRLYGRLSLTEHEAMDAKWSTLWDTLKPIEQYFKGLEDVYILATNYLPKFTMAQMVGHAKTTMEKCRMFQQHLNKWSQFPVTN